MSKAASILLFALIAGCRHDPPPSEHRARIERVGGSQIRVIPEAGQMPNCLLFSASDGHIVRQLTMSDKNLSVPCEKDQPIGGLVYKIPPGEGHVKIHVVFSDRVIEAGPIAQQIHELSEKRPTFSGIDLRAPGTVVIESIDFTPTP